jgi:two-component system, sensor histidine kinase RegB
MLPPPLPQHPNRINFGWLLRLRGAMIAGQLLAIGGARMALRVELPYAALLAIVAAEGALNVAAGVAQRRREPEEWWLVAIMALDIVLFTSLLHLTGGPSNPFSFLYLVQIALAAITVRVAWSWALTGLALLGSAVLFVVPGELPAGISHARYMELHLRGMWVAFGVAAAFIVTFLFRVRRSLEQREAELDESRRATARQERLASLATLAAGAAHELATPLATIAVAVKELERNHLRSLEVASASAPPGPGATPTSASAASSSSPPALADVRLIREQVDRCRAILERMSSEAGEGSGENWTPLAVPELVRAALLGLPATVTIRPELSPAVMQGRLRIPQRAVAQALRGLVKNAQEATAAGGGQVRLRVDAVADGVVFAVEDQGAGIPAASLERLGEPFFTTKPAGTGMGLGVFLARAVAERLGGSLRVDSKVGRGTVAVLTLPLEAPAAREPPR